MGIKKKSVVRRISPEFEEKAMRLMEERFKRGLCSRKDLNLPEATRLMSNSMGIEIIGEEFRTKRKRKK